MSSLLLLSTPRFRPVWKQAEPKAQRSGGVSGSAESCGRRGPAAEGRGRTSGAAVHSCARCSLREAAWASGQRVPTPLAWLLTTCASCAPPSPKQRAWGPAASACPELRASVRTPGPAAPGPTGSTPRASFSRQHTSLLHSANSARLRFTPGPGAPWSTPGGSPGAHSSTPNPAGSRSSREPLARVSPAAGAPRG